MKCVEPKENMHVGKISKIVKESYREERTRVGSTVGVTELWSKGWPPPEISPKSFYF